MTRAEARTILQGFRPNGADWPRRYFAEALALAEQDPELKAWWDVQADFDRKVSSRLAAVPVPEELRDAILSANKIATFPPQPLYSTWLAAAALAALLCVASTFYYVRHHGAMDRGDYIANVVGLLGNDAPHLAMLTPDHDQISAWLQQQHAPMGSMPSKLNAMPPLGCQRYEVNGFAVSLICFTMQDGHEAHLFIVEKRALNDPPGSDPAFDGLPGGYCVAAWSDDKMAYVLATTGGEPDLRALL